MDDQLFFKVWNNVYIRKKILTDCLFFRNHSRQLKMQCKKIINHNFKNYLLNLQITKSDIPIGFIYPPYLETLNISTRISTQLPDTLKNLTTSHIWLTIDNEDDGIKKSIFTPNSTITNLTINNEKITLDSIPLDGLPNSVESLKILHFQQDKIILPSNLSTLNIVDSFELTSKFTNSMIYQSLTSLYFGFYCRCKSFDQLVDQLKLFVNLKTLRLGGLFDKELQPGDLPKSLTNLEFKSRFYDCPIVQDVIPPNVTKLLINHNFKNKVETFIPDTVESLEFGMEVSKISGFTIPDSIKSLKMGQSYGECLPSSLPSDLEILDLSCSRFDQRPFKGDSISKLQNLKTLKYSTMFSHVIPSNYLPNSIESLQLGTDEFYDYVLPLVLPTSLSNLIISKHHEPVNSKNQNLNIIYK